MKKSTAKNQKLRNRQLFDLPYPKKERGNLGGYIFWWRENCEARDTYSRDMHGNKFDNRLWCNVHVLRANALSFFSWQAIVLPRTTSCKNP